MPSTIIHLCGTRENSRPGVYDAAARFCKGGRRFAFSWPLLAAAAGPRQRHSRRQFIPRLDPDQRQREGRRLRPAIGAGRLEQLVDLALAVRC